MCFSKHFCSLIHGMKVLLASHIKIGKITTTKFYEKNGEQVKNIKVVFYESDTEESNESLHAKDNDSYKYNEKFILDTLTIRGVQGDYLYDLKISDFIDFVEENIIKQIDLKKQLQKNGEV